MRPGLSPSKSAMVELGVNCPSNASRVGNTTSSPWSTSSAGGTSGCQRLWPLSGWSLSDLPRSISMTFIVNSFSVAWTMLPGTLRYQLWVCGAQPASIAPASDPRNL